MGVRIRLCHHYHHRQALSPPVLSPHVPEFSHQPQIQSRPLQSRRRECPLGAGHFPGLCFRVRFDLYLLGPHELRGLYRCEDFLGGHGYPESFHRHCDIDFAEYGGVEAPDQEAAEGRYIGNLSSGRLVRHRSSSEPIIGQD